uniref:Uncharacterized protein n=1 Tax=Lactuca sativa TaxID=4236 RepID=A0A9R1VJG5_LACSA|nr:hypothetical protein LSAT_V11C500253390 [Lactuca sativa]
MKGTMAPLAEKRHTGSAKRKLHGKSKGDSKHHKTEPEPLDVTSRGTAEKTPTTTAGESRNSFECNQPRNFRKDCQKLKNQGGNGMVHMMTARDALQEPPMVIGLSTIGFETRKEHKFRKRNETYTIDMEINQIERTLEIVTNCLLTLNNLVIDIETKDPCW